MTEIIRTLTSEQWAGIYRELDLWHDDTHYIDTAAKLRATIAAAANAGALPAGTALVDDDDHPGDGGRIRLPLDDHEHGEALLSDYLPHSAFTYQCCEEPDCRACLMAIDSLTHALTTALLTVEALQSRYARRIVVQINALQSERLRAAVDRWRAQRTNIDKAEAIAAGDHLADAAEAVIANAEKHRRGQ